MNPHKYLLIGTGHSNLKVRWLWIAHSVPEARHVAPFTSTQQFRPPAHTHNSRRCLHSQEERERGLNFRSQGQPSEEGSIVHTCEKLKDAQCDSALPSSLERSRGFLLQIRRILTRCLSKMHALKHRCLASPKMEVSCREERKQLTSVNSAFLSWYWVRNWNFRIKVLNVERISYRQELQDNETICICFGLTSTLKYCIQCFSGSKKSPKHGAKTKIQSISLRHIQSNSTNIYYTKP